MAKNKTRCPIDGTVEGVGDEPIDHCPVCGAGIDIKVEPVADYDHYTEIVGDRPIK